MQLLRLLFKFSWVERNYWQISFLHSSGTALHSIKDTWTSFSACEGEEEHVHLYTFYASYVDVTRSLQRTWSLHCVCICLYLSTRLLGAAVSVCRRPRLRWDCCSWLGSRVGLARPSLGSPPTSDPLGWPAQPSPDTAAARQHQFLIAFCINIAWSWYSALLNYS